MILLVLGALLGLVVAGYGILRQDFKSTPLPESAVARVNDRLISREGLERALARIESAYETQEGNGSEVAVLHNLVDEELLLQRGLALGMAYSDATVRTAIINSLVASVTAEADAADPPDEELQRYLEAHADRFSYTEKMAVRAWQTTSEPDAQQFVAQLRDSGTAPDIESVVRVPDLPDALVSIDIARGYIGAGIAAAVAGMPAGSSSIFARRGQWLIIQVLQKETATITDLDSVRNRVLLDYRRSMADEQLRDYLDGLRNRADITVSLP